MDNDVGNMTEEDWEKKLSPEEYRLLRLKETERAFTGKYNSNKKEGIYYCAGCGTPLFDSESKYNSGSGWPSFFQPISDKNILTETDKSQGMIRTEIMCNKCGGHLGHLFDDGPQDKTGLRYCLNSGSLKFNEGE
ncbi:MAG: Peptide methionine sulfoxide reductase MsrB [Candidatus Heimdallarchaeota archaeon LC_2]|nr:MAG: Peptide methionine sulfoxide reductase MsrB [Candidatus Heimdallarchaeota archaeon LC_2]